MARRPEDEFDRLLEHPHPVGAELARGMLEAAGIPSMTHGADFDVAELGPVTHGLLRRPHLYVPKGTAARAAEVLREAGWADPIELDPSEPPLGPATTRRWQRWTLLFLWLGLPLLMWLAIVLLR